MPAVQTSEFSVDPKLHSPPFHRTSLFIIPCIIHCILKSRAVEPGNEATVSLHMQAV